MSASRISDHITAWVKGPAGGNIRRYLVIGGVSLCGVSLVFALSFLQMSEHVRQRMQESGIHFTPLSIEFMPIPVVFLLWMRLMERSEKFNLSFSPFFAVFSIVGFIVMQMLTRYPVLKQWVLVVAVIAGLFVQVSFQECLRRMKQQPRPALVAVIAATAAFNYYWLFNRISAMLCHWTTQAVYTILRAFDMYAAAAVHPREPGIFVIASPYFILQVTPDCSGLEGMFLFSFLLSVILLIDWQVFRQRRILPLYVVGAIYMFLVNDLRIASFFAVGYWAYRRDAWQWVQSLQGAPVFLFHSYVGLVVYLMAFGIFTVWLYRSIEKPVGR